MDARVQTDLSPLVAEEIRALMARRRMSGRQLAARLNVSPAWISYRLTGSQEIGLNDLGRIAAVLGVSVHDLIPGGTLSTTAQFLTSPQVTPHAARGTSPRGIRSRRRLAEPVAA